MKNQITEIRNVDIDDVQIKLQTPCTSHKDLWTQNVHANFLFA